MKYRSRTDIIAMILQAAIHGATKTRLMYSAYLSYAQVQEYLQYLLEKGLINLEETTHSYTLTEQGLRFLRVYDEISEIVSLKGMPTSEDSLKGLPTSEVDASALVGQP
jgi:predicted transcriptional regulator